MEEIIIKPIKLLIGGSPCTFWSVAQHPDKRETTASGLGWELFENFLIAKDKFQPDFFLYENNKSMASAIKEQISYEFGVEPYLINSALVSAQNRQRYYWTNIEGIGQPEDRRIVLNDILENGCSFRKDKSYCIDANYYKGGNLTGFNRQSGMRLQVAEKLYELGHVSKSTNNDTRLTARTGGIGTNATTTVQTDSVATEPLRVGTYPNKNSELKNSQGYRIYSPEGKSVALCSNSGGIGSNTGLYVIPTMCKNQPIHVVKNGLITIKGETYPIKLSDGYYVIRKLTPVECERLQTLPDNYTKAVSNTQRYKGLGNGWTVDVIAHIFKGINNA